MSKALLLQTNCDLWDECCGYLIKDRLSFTCFLCLGLVDPVSDANAIWRRRGPIRSLTASDAAANDGARLAEVT